MVKTLVVMRHGKAMPLAPNQQDEDRELTPAGAAALSARLPHMLRLLETNDAPVRIWASPAVRARQTAELLAAALRANNTHPQGTIELHDSLWEQDMTAFLDELRTSQDEFVFAVGHVPFAEDIVEDLVGTTPPFSTGALCCLEVHFADEDAQDAASAQDSARLLWFAQGPVAAHWNTLVQVQETFTQTAEAIEDRRRAFFAKPEDIETIHRFRTNIRTLRSFVAFVKPWQSAEQNARMQALLKEIVGYTSRLRELDVLEKHVRANPESSPKLVAFCKKEARAERSRVLKILASKRVTKMFEQAMADAKDIAWKSRFATQGLAQSVVRGRFDALIEAVGADLANVDLSNEEQTHDVRKRAKRARYVAEFNSGILGSDAVDIAKAMTAHQDALGDVCDARANIRLMSEFLQRKLPKSVARDLTRMRTQNEELLQSILSSQGAA